MQYIISHQALWLPAPSAEPSAANITRFNRLSVPGGRHSLEGLWKGTYGGHGLEIVTLELSQDGSMLLARKVGAPDVLPAACAVKRTHVRPMTA